MVFSISFRNGCQDELQYKGETFALERGGADAMLRAAFPPVRESEEELEWAILSALHSYQGDLPLLLDGRPIPLHEGYTTGQEWKTLRNGQTLVRTADEVVYATYTYLDRTELSERVTVRQGRVVEVAINTFGFLNGLEISTPASPQWHHDLAHIKKITRC
jgi:hypothetical protein